MTNKVVSMKASKKGDPGKPGGNGNGNGKGGNDSTMPFQYCILYQAIGTIKNRVALNPNQLPAQGYGTQGNVLLGMKQRITTQDCRNVIGAVENALTNKPPHPTIAEVTILNVMVLREEWEECR